MQDAPSQEAGRTGCSEMEGERQEEREKQKDSHDTEAKGGISRRQSK